MARNKIRIWYDKEGDYLEVLFGGPDIGTFEETAHDAVMVRLNLEKEVTGFSVLGVTKLDKAYLDLSLEPVEEEAET